MDKYSNNLIGFEVEGLSDGELINRGQLLRLLLKLDNRIILSDDGSLRTNNGIKVSNAPEQDNFYGEDGLQFSYEIKTPPLYPYHALELLKKIFNLIEKYGYVNSTCGIHLNISSLDKNLTSKINLLNFAIHPIWIKLGKAFKRNKNKTCYNSLIDIKGIRGKRRWKKIYNLGRELYNKRRYVTFRHWTGSERGRLEVRIMGGENYHRKFNLIKEYTEKILDIFNNAAGSQFIPKKAKF